MISKLPRLLFRTLRSVRFAAGAAGSSIPQIPWAPPELGRRSLFSGAVMAAQGSSPLQADSQRLEAKEEEEEEEAGRGGGGGKVQPPTASKQLSQQIDGKQTVECKKKERKKQKKKPYSSNNSIDNLMAEMPFAGADIELELSTSTKSKLSVKKKRKRIAGKGSEEDSTITKKKKNQDRPNYFISVPITNPKIIDGIQTLQNTIIQKDNRLSKAMIHYGSFHVTLLVMHLSNEEAISNGVGAFLESGGLIEELLQGKPLNLSFQGTDHFRNQIGFVKLTEGDNTTTLLKIAETEMTINERLSLIYCSDRQLACNAQLCIHRPVTKRATIIIYNHRARGFHRQRLKFIGNLSIWKPTSILRKKPQKNKICYCCHIREIVFEGYKAKGST